MTVSLTQDKITKIKTLPSSLLDNSFCVNREVAYWSPNFQFTRCQVWSPVLQKFRNEQSCCSEEAQRGNKLTTWCNNSCYMYNGTYTNGPGPGSMDRVHGVVHGPRSMFCIRPV